MKGKKKRKRAKARAASTKPSFSMTWKFPNGDGSLPVVVVKRRIMRQLHDMERDGDSLATELLQRIAAEETAREASHVRRAMSNRRNASLPRGRRKPSLQIRGLRVLLSSANITAEQLWDQLETGSMTFDDDDIEISRKGNQIVIRDLATRASVKEATIRKLNLRSYLVRARNS